MSCIGYKEKMISLTTQSYECHLYKNSCENLLVEQIVTHNLTPDKA